MTDHVDDFCLLQGKLEREQLAKDLAEGRAPTMKLPAPAGRGRGMTMPAWMRKKMFVIGVLDVIG